jgi:carbonic anhydrase
MPDAAAPPDPTGPAAAPCRCGGDHGASAAASPSRRTLLFGGLGVGAAAALPTAARAAAASSPEAAVQALVDGNRRFTEGRMTSFAANLRRIREQTAASQAPFAALLSCADSRVPVELIFDQTIGGLFVNRVAGNIATSELIASLEYGAAVLGTKAIMVLGHSDCGAVKATIAAKPVPGQISALYRPIMPAVVEAGPHLEAATKANAKIQAGLLRTASPVLAGLVKERRLKIVAAYYDLKSGAVSLLA